MKWVLLIVLGFALVAGVVAIVGVLLPRAHSASRRAAFPVPPEAVWTVITDVQAFPSWRADVKAVKALPERDGRMAWIEETRSGSIPLVVERSEPPRLLILRIADPNLPFGGTWTYEITPTPGGSAMTITENGEVYNPIFRFMARFVFGYEATMASYLSSLEKRLARTT